ncbi:MAG: hypothetical protein ACYC35_10380 [Pirellulales bacterium]
MRLHNRSLDQTQREVLESLGYTVREADGPAAIEHFPCLVVSDDVYFTYHAMAGFLREVRRRQGRNAAARKAGAWPECANYRAGLAVSELTERFLPRLQGPLVCGEDGTQHRAYGVYFLRHLDSQRPLEDQAEVVPVPYAFRRLRPRAHRFFEPSGRFSIPISLVAFFPVQHWAALVAVNLLGMSSFLLRQARSRPWDMLTLPCRMLCRAGSVRPSRLAGKLYLAGRGCRIHPSAHLEAAVLGNGVRVGPNAVVRGAVIGSRSEIGPGAIVEGSSLGERVGVSGNVILRCSVVLDEANIGAAFTQLSVVGRSTAMCPGSGIYDFNLRGDVPVSFQGRTVATGSRLLGSCLGHGAFLGPEVPLASGQEVPNGCVLIRNPRMLVGNVEDGLPEHVVRMDRARSDHAQPRNRAA